MSLKRPNKKTAIIVATYETDLGLVLNWLRLNKAISSASARREVSGAYAITVKSKMKKSELNTLVKDRFGVFAKVI